MSFLKIACTVSAGLMGLQLYAKSPVNFNLDHEHIPGELIVKFKGEIPKEWQNYVKKTLSEPVQFITKASRSKMAVISFKGDQAEVKNLKKIAEYLSSLANVETVEANAIYRLTDTVPNDPEFEKLYGLKNSSNFGKDIDAVRAWDISTGSRDILVGVIDTGIDYTHPDLAANYWTNPGENGLDANGNDKRSNGLDDDGNGYIDDFRGWDFINGDNDPMDDHSHGSHCAGTIGAVGDNGVGVVGVNWQVSLVGLKVFSGDGQTTTDALVEAINYATTIGVDLTNNSWGGGAASDLIRSAIENADRAGILFIAAAGNSAIDIDNSPFYPAAYELENIIAVASTDNNDQLSSFSNYGAKAVDIAAPGSSIYSTIPGGYDYKSGTSMATPHVSGLAALVKSVFKDWDHLQVKARILSASVPLSSLTKKVNYGRISASSSLETDEVAPAVPESVSIDMTDLESIKISWHPSGDDLYEGDAAYYQARISAEPITEDNWASAEVFELQSLVQGTDKFEASINNLEVGFNGYIALKAVDNVGNRSAVSATVPFTLPFPSYYEINTGSLDTFTEIEAPWGIETIDGNDYVSDSPGGSYENNQSISAVSQSYPSRDDLFLIMKTKYEIEQGYDNGYVEISVDGGSWETLQTLTGSAGWHNLKISLASVTSSSSSFKLRFRFTSDYSVVLDGWLIDEFKIVGK